MKCNESLMDNKKNLVGKRAIYESGVFAKISSL